MRIALFLALLVPGTPVPVQSAGWTPSDGKLRVFRAGSVQCGEGMVTPRHREQPLATIGYGDAKPVTLRFRIDEAGRPLGIREEGGGNDDLAPALAAWQFGAGMPQPECTALFTPTDISPKGDAKEIRRYLALQRFRTALPDRYRPAVEPEGSDCFRPYPAPRLTAHPDYLGIPAMPGEITMTTVLFDLDSAGRPARVRTLDGGENAALDAAGRDAIERSRFAPGARTGCTYPFHRNQTVPLTAPPLPEAASLAPAGAVCATAVGWEVEPQLIYPPAFSRRAIEGWAVVAFDVAPWGATGNVRVLASEPAAAFGEAAVRIVQRARKRPSTTGASGCVERVRFVMPDPDAAPVSPGGE